MPDVSRLPFGRSGAGIKPDPSSQATSNIPVLRREKRRNQVATAQNLGVRNQGDNGPRGRQAHDPRWDPYSGEITTSDKGKPQSVKPGTFTAPGLRSVYRETGLPLGNESNITSGQKTHTSFGDRVRNLKSHTKASVERPEWKGATGRVALVSPVADQLDMPPISLPRKSSKRVASPHSGQSSPVSVTRSGNGETSPTSAQMSRDVDPTIGTVLSNSNRNNPQITSNPTINVTPDPVTVSPSAATKTLTRKTVPTPAAVPTAHTSTRHQKEDSAGTFERSFRDNYEDVSFQPTEQQDPYNQPPSRFSVTTYATSEAQSTPRPSTDAFDTHPMPTPQSFAAAHQQSILDHKRPKLAESPKPSMNSAVSRKAIHPSSPVFISMSSRDSLSSRRTSNMAKTLPMSPAEAESHDLITSLQAQLDNLAHRRNNITKSIRQMTELMPTDNVLLTEEVRRKREVEKQKIESLRVEEADVRREEHDIGLRLHRAWKRKDKEAVYEPTGLWVRRVTG
jgi:hypothetical protein